MTGKGLTEDTKDGSDSDLDDLLQSPEKDKNDEEDTDSDEGTSDEDSSDEETDDEEGNKSLVAKEKQKASAKVVPHDPAITWCEALCSLLLIMVTSRVSLVFSTIFLVFLVVLLVCFTVGHERRKHGLVPEIGHDYTDVNSVYELSIGDIDHWCIFGTDDGCSCEDPLEPISHAEIAGWLRAHKMNKALIKDIVREERDIDIAFIGDSITEEWNGRWVGMQAERFRKISQVFDRFFNKDKGADINGVALGIAGDTSPNLLWRLQHGEMPDDFNPNIWWILVGLNDLVRTGCSEEVVLLGILRIVEEIQFRKPDALIVINGLLPTTAYAYERKEKLREYKKTPNKDDFSTDAIEVDVDHGFRKHYIERRRRVPLATSITTINIELSRFSLKHKNVFYFDANKIFYMDMNELGFRDINPVLLPDGVHPTAEGHHMWASKIVKRVQEMKKKQAKGEI